MRSHIKYTVFVFNWLVVEKIIAFFFVLQRPNFFWNLVVRMKRNIHHRSFCHPSEGGWTEFSAPDVEIQPQNDTECIKLCIKSQTRTKTPNSMAGGFVAHTPTSSESTHTLS